MAARWQLKGRILDLDAPIGAGIVNVTDDSMFEGARSGTPERAIEDALALAEAGFEMLDVGAVAAGGFRAVAPENEAGKLIPAIEGLAGRTDLPVSADTYSPEVAGALSTPGPSRSTTSVAGSRRCWRSRRRRAAGWW